jgi:hypothetical protein
MLTDFTQFVWFWVGDVILITTAFTVAGAVLLAILHVVAARRRPG